MTETETETRNYTGVTTGQIVAEMLKENTGRGLCDSGDAYGRNWQRNAARDFAAGPVVSCTWRTWRKEGEPHGVPEPDTTISLYHWMVGCLEFDPEMQARLDAFVANEDVEDESWLGIQEMFAEHEHAAGLHEREPNTINTYNDPDSWHCSQVLQYVEVYAEDRQEPSHLIVSVHGGCDVRGGYTAPKCFKLRVEYYEALDKAQVRTLGMGDSWWGYGDGCWRYCDASDDAPVSDPCTLPCYELDWLDEEPAFAEINAAIGRVEVERAALTATTLSADQIYAAGQQLDNAAVNLADERTALAVELLAGWHDACTFVADNRLYMVYTPKDHEFAACKEVVAYSDL